MPAIASGADTLANSLFTSLTAGLDFTIPEVDPDLPLFDQPGTTGPIYGSVSPITINELTTGVGGTGVFDKLMVSITNHLKVEYENNRISGAEYTKAYIGLVAAALQTAQSFLLSRDQAYWQALLVQAQAKAADVEAVSARINLEAARVLLARGQYEAATAEVNFALTKMKVATEDATYNNLSLQGEGIDYTNDNILPQQKKLLEEQTEVQRAQTMNTRSDGTTTITGSIGKQKDLYTQQIESYKRDAETKVAKIFTDAWITQKTIDEGLLAPSQFQNTAVNDVLTRIRTANNMT